MIERSKEAIENSIMNKVHNCSINSAIDMLDDLESDKDNVTMLFSSKRSSIMPNKSLKSNDKVFRYD